MSIGIAIIEMSDGKREAVITYSKTIEEEQHSHHDGCRVLRLVRPGQKHPETRALCGLLEMCYQGYRFGGNSSVGSLFLEIFEAGEETGILKEMHKEED